MKHVPIRLGPLALLLAVISICLTILAVLSFTTGQADLRLAQRYADTVTERYALEALKAARDVECRIFDLRSEFLLQRDFPSLMCEDGIHPNKDGYQLISKAVMAMA